MDSSSWLVLGQFLLAVVDFLDRRGLFQRVWCWLVKKLSWLLRSRVVVKPEGPVLPARGVFGPRAEPVRSVRRYDWGSSYSYMAREDGLRSLRIARLLLMSTTSVLVAAVSVLWILLNSGFVAS